MNRVAVRFMLVDFGATISKGRRKGHEDEFVIVLEFAKVVVSTVRRHHNHRMADGLRWQQPSRKTCVERGVNDTEGEKG